MVSHEVLVLVRTGNLAIFSDIAEVKVGHVFQAVTNPFLRVIAKFMSGCN